MPISEKETAHTENQKGNQRFTEGRYNDALKHYDAAIKSNPSWSIPYYNKRHVKPLLQGTQEGQAPSSSIPDLIDAIGSLDLEKEPQLPTVGASVTSDKSKANFAVSTIFRVPDPVPEDADSVDSSDVEGSDVESDLYTTIRKKGNTKLTDKCEEVPTTTEMDSSLINNFVKKLSEKGFESADEPSLNIGVSVGFNKMKSLSTRKNRVLYGTGTRADAARFSQSNYRFFWFRPWYDNKGEMVSYEDVQKYYKRLKRCNREKARELIKLEEKDLDDDIPYQTIREYARNHEQTRSMINLLREEVPDVPTYLSLIDSDVEDFNGIYSAYLRIIRGCCNIPRVMTTGYEFPNTNRALQMHSQWDRKVRIVTAFHMPLGTYYPEPNMCILVPNGNGEQTVPESFVNKQKGEGKTLESAVLLTRLTLETGREDCIFSEDSPIITSIPRRMSFLRRRKGRKLKPATFSEPFQKGLRGPNLNDIKLFYELPHSYITPFQWRHGLSINGAFERIADNNRKECKKIIHNMMKTSGKDQSSYEQSKKGLSNLVPDNDLRGDIVAAIEEYTKCVRKLNDERASDDEDASDDE